MALPQNNTCTTTVTAHAAVGVHDDLTTGQAAVTVRATNHELARRIDEEASFLVQKLCRNHLLDKLFDDFLFDGRMLEFLP